MEDPIFLLAGTLSFTVDAVELKRGTP